MIKLSYERFGPYNLVSIFNAEIDHEFKNALLDAPKWIVSCFRPY